MSPNSGKWFFETNEHQIIEKNWDAAYNAWKSFIQDEELLPSYPSGSDIAQSNHHISPKTKFAWFLPELPIDWLPLVLLFSFHSQVGDRYIKGKALARLDSGKLALVPASSEKGDLLVTLVDKNYYRSQYIFRRLSLGEQQVMSMDTEIFASPDTTGPSVNDTDWSVLHCRFVGHCLRHDHRSMDGFHGHYHRSLPSSNSHVFIVH